MGAPFDSLTPGALDDESEEFACEASTESEPLEWPARRVWQCSVRLSLDGGQTFLEHDPLPFTLYGATTQADVQTIEPARGPAKGGSRVAVRLPELLKRAAAETATTKFEYALVRLRSKQTKARPDLTIDFIVPSSAALLEFF